MLLLLHAHSSCLYPRWRSTAAPLLSGSPPALALRYLNTARLTSLGTGTGGMPRMNGSGSTWDTITLRSPSACGGGGGAGRGRRTGCTSRPADAFHPEQGAEGSPHAPRRLPSWPARVRAQQRHQERVGEHVDDDVPSLHEQERVEKQEAHGDVDGSEADDEALEELAAEALKKPAAMGDPLTTSRARQATTVKTLAWPVT